MSFTAAASLSGLTPTIITRAPAFTSAVATPLPIPLPPPVTRQFRSANDSCTTTPSPKLEHVLAIEPRGDGGRRPYSHRVVPWPLNLTQQTSTTWSRWPITPLGRPAGLSP